MQDKIYKLRYLPLFEQDLLDTVNYISKVLKNEEAAMRLINDIMEVRRLLYGARNIENSLN